MAGCWVNPLQELGQTWEWQEMRMSRAGRGALFLQCPVLPLALPYNVLGYSQEATHDSTAQRLLGEGR